MTEFLKKEIEELFINLKLTNEVFRQVDPEKAKKVIDQIKDRFVGNITKGWWWEHFKFRGERIRFINSDGYKALSSLVPVTETLLWLIADGPGSERIVYEGTINAFIEIIKEAAYLQEYYIVPQDEGWLICYNHHDYLITLGEPVESRVRSLNQ